MPVGTYFFFTLALHLHSFYIKVKTTTKKNKKQYITNYEKKVTIKY